MSSPPRRSMMDSSLGAAGGGAGAGAGSLTSKPPAPKSAVKPPCACGGDWALGAAGGAAAKALFTTSFGASLPSTAETGCTCSCGAAGVSEYHRFCWYLRAHDEMRTRGEREEREQHGVSLRTGRATRSRGHGDREPQKQRDRKQLRTTAFSCEKCARRSGSASRTFALGRHESCRRRPRRGLRHLPACSAPSTLP